MTPGPDTDLDDVPEWVNTTAGAGASTPEPEDQTPGDQPRDQPLPDGATVSPRPPVFDHPRAHRARWSRRRQLVTTLAIFIAVVVLVVVGGVVFVERHLGGSGGATVEVTIPADASHGQLTSLLTKAGVVSDGWLFSRYLGYRNFPTLKAGTYNMHRHEGYRAALADLDQGPRVVQVRLTIPEGFDLAQTAAAVGQLPGFSASQFLAVANSGAVRSPYEAAGSNNLEGLLFPDTYFVAPGEPYAQILQAMIDRFDQIAVQAGLAPGTSANGLTAYQNIVLASLVEAEAKVPQDRGKIAEVILNRLKANMKLQIDATVEYAEGVHKTRLLDSDLTIDSPYNTYRVSGLPPGPIDAPGAASLQATLNPTAGPWLYYVVIDTQGDSGFATTPAEFQQLVQLAKSRGVD